MLRFEEVSAGRGETWSEERRPALCSISLALGPGEAVALVGRTGAGKSTAILAAAGLISPWGGRVTLFGEDVRLAARKRPGWLRRRVGVALQFPERGFFQTSVRDEIALTCRLLRMPEEETKAGIERALRLCGLGEDVLDRSPFTLSGGEKRKVALACALAHGPSLLLLDEPEAGLDRWGREGVRSLIADFAAAGGAVVAATHDAAWGLSWASRVIVLREGRVACDIAVPGAPLETIAAELAPWLPDGGAWARLSARAQALGVPIPLAYRDEQAFLEALAERLGGKRA